MDEKFTFWMQWFGAKCSPYELIKGDFLDPVHKPMILGSKLIFVNNYAFGPRVNHELKTIFADLPNDAAIVSSVEFAAGDFERVTQRNMNELGILLDKKRVGPILGEVSWTSKPVTYHVQFIDLSRVSTTNCHILSFLSSCFFCSFVWIDYSPTFLSYICLFQVEAYSGGTQEKVIIICYYSMKQVIC